MKADRKPDIASVAALIARGPLPEWLIPYLEHFQAGIANEGSINPTPEYVRERMKGTLAAIEVLEKDLPIFRSMPFGYRNKSAEVVLHYLPGVKKDVEACLSPRRGRKSDFPTEICVAVVANCWQRIHGKAPFYSDPFREACDDYWQACGRKSKGDLANWRKFIKRASENKGISSMLAAIDAAMVPNSQ